ncbi:MAG: hypothetical protein JXB19_09395, partial [Bacteroidales bacterium]|nr:hypothetical protein [Bacteroidales bacterium]
MKTESASRDLEWYRRRYESIKKCRTIYRNRWERTIHELLEEREKVKKLESGYLNLINDQLNDLSRKI